MNSTAATITGFVIAPLAAVLLLGALQGTNPVSQAGMFPIVYLYTLLAEIALAFPIFLLLKRFALVRWWSAVAGGMLTSMVVWILFNWRDPSGVSGFATLLFSGGGAGLVFWLIWRLGKSQDGAKPQ